MGFSDLVAEKLKYYVYRLIDPRNGETFYVGVGKKDRVFSHANAAKDSECDDLNDKIKRINEIRNSGLEVGHVIHRHGMDKETAYEVEAALIDAYPGLTNIIAGEGSNDFGVMHVNEIIKLYEAEEAKIIHKALLININKSWAERALYDATRFAWKLNIERAKKAEVVLAHKQGLIVGAYIPKEWKKVTLENFPEFEVLIGPKNLSRRFGFIGEEADEATKIRYVGKRVPGKYRKRGAQGPIRYAWEGI